jgi:hypothetical protein
MGANFQHAHVRGVLSAVRKDIPVCHVGNKKNIAAPAAWTPIFNMSRIVAFSMTSLCIPSTSGWYRRTTVWPAVPWPHLRRSGSE